jgi:hypothetical protein
VSPTANATRKAIPRRIRVISGPRSFQERNTESTPISGVAIRKAMAAAVGTPFFTRLRKTGATPQEQIGSGMPMAIPRRAWEIRPRPWNHCSIALGRKACRQPAATSPRRMLGALSTKRSRKHSSNPDPAGAPGSSCSRLRCSPRSATMEMSAPSPLQKAMPRW